MNSQTVREWLEDIDARKTALRDFATGTQGKILKDRHVWSEGYYILLHFDLMDTSPGGEIDRTSVCKRIEDYILSYGGSRLGGSVFQIPIGLGSSKHNATLFWNGLCATVSHVLVGGDAFFLHYAPSAVNKMGGIAFVVPRGGNSLETAAVPDE